MQGWNILIAVCLFISRSHKMPEFKDWIFSGETDLHPFAFRTHAHSYGRVISAFYKNPKKGWTMIGKRNPQWPQLFEPIKANLTISSGDLMAATCVYDSSQLKKVIYMGLVPLLASMLHALKHFLNLSIVTSFFQKYWCWWDV